METESISPNLINEKSGPHWLNESLALDLLNGQTLEANHDHEVVDILDKPQDPSVS